MNLVIRVGFGKELARRVGVGRHCKARRLVDRDVTTTLGSCQNGSSLVVSGTTGFFLAGLVSSVGFAGIGAWLVVLNRSHGEAAMWSQRLRWLGVLAGGLMMVGIVTAPGILLRLDDMETAPGWIWIGFLGWLGTFAAYPAWAVSIGLVETRVPRLALPSTDRAV